ncbi:MAG TPA: hypothetical protein VN714_09125 [Trebonia sp.]|jgi:hypothetical protein|nr:hypothetical protein [Trebonia sp.]
MRNHKQRPATGSRSRLAAAAIAGAVAACLAAAGCSGAAPGTLLGSGHPTVGTATAVASHGPLTGPPADLTGPPADPFAGTPAEHWTDGAAGIVLPPARPAGSFTTAQVKLAYEWTRKMLIAGELDKTTLDGGTPSAFADLLTSGDRKWFLDNLNLKGKDKNGTPLSSRAEVVSFAPGSVQFVTNVIRVHGTMSAQASSYKGVKVLDVRVNYLFTYAVEPPHHPEQWMRLVSETGWLLQFGSWQGAATTFEPWFSITDSAGIAGNSCGNTDGFVHPFWPGVVRHPSESGSGVPVNPYVPGQAKTATCQSTTGT